MSFEFTNLHHWKTRPEMGDPDTQISEFIKSLKGEIKSNWQVLAPTPNERVIYFELQGSVSKPETVSGTQKYIRDMARGEKSVNDDGRKAKRRRG